MPFEDVGDGLVRNLVVERLQGADDLLVTPGIVFRRQLEDQLFDLPLGGWSSWLGWFLSFL